MALAASIAFFPIGTAMAQSCESQAVSATGKPLHGAAKNSFVKKCKTDACEPKAVSADGKPLHIFISDVSVKLTGSDKWMPAQ